LFKSEENLTTELAENVKNENDSDEAQAEGQNYGGAPISTKRRRFVRSRDNKKIGC
jgi:hypothetical protein